MDEHCRSRRRPTSTIRRDTIIALTASVFLGLGVGLVNFPSPDEHSSAVAAIYPPWWSTRQVWRAAASAGDILNIGGSEFVLLLHSDAPGLAVRARRSGALLVIDPRGFGGCGASWSKQSA
jgi:hypothetical protein